MLLEHRNRPDGGKMKSRARAAELGPAGGGRAGCGTVQRLAMGLGTWPGSYLDTSPQVTLAQWGPWPGRAHW